MTAQAKMDLIAQAADQHHRRDSALQIGIASPVKIDPTASLSDDDATQLATQYATHGFARFEFPLPYSNVENRVLELTRELGLGEPYVPQYIRAAGLGNANGTNPIRASAPNPDSPPKHQAFQTTNAQALHVDGTTEPIGLVKSSLLICVSPAEIGGESIVFNAVGAFLELARYDSDAAAALLHPESLYRGAKGQSLVAGPVFAIRGDTIVSRYSTDYCSHWNFGNVSKLELAYECLKDMAQAGSPFYTEFRLAANQGVLLANSVVSHGRGAFRDSATRARHMIRALFLNEPKQIGN